MAIINAAPAKSIEHTTLSGHGRSPCSACGGGDSLASILMSLRNIEERLSRLERAVTVSPDSVLLTAGLENGSDALLSVKEAAARMGLSAATIYRLVGNGQLKALRIGTGRGAVRIRPDALHDYVARGNCKQHDGSSDRRRSTLRLKHLKVRR